MTVVIKPLTPDLNWRSEKKKKKKIPFEKVLLEV